MYEYRAKVIRVVDGDTVWLDVDLGMDIHTNISCRLAGINAPELPTPEGIAAKEHLVKLLGTEPIILRTIKDRREKYGRYLANLYIQDLHVNNKMVEDGHARFY